MQAAFPALIVTALLLASCATAPVTGRQQIMLVSEDEAAQMGRQAYQEILSTEGVSSDPRLTGIVDQVGRRIAQVSRKPDLDWQFNVISNDTPNAFALPGGYVGVHTGLFKVVETDDELAAVLAHEIGHVDARHSAERMSTQALVQTGLAATVGGSSQALVDLASTAATLGVILPFSREQEAEADVIGLKYMAEAGYDPRAAVEVWRKMQELGNGGAIEFLSTHPSPGNRIERLEELMPQAMEIYEQHRRD